MKRKTFNRLLDKLAVDPNDMGYGIHSDLVMEAYSDALAGHKDYLWWNLCFDQNENPVYSCPINPDAQLRPSPGVCMGDLAVFRYNAALGATAEDEVATCNDTDDIWFLTGYG